MELAHRWADRNLTRLELVIACLLLALFIGYFIRYTLIIFTVTERTMVNTSIVNINSALKYHATIAVMRGDKMFLAGLMSRSPFQVITTAQESYLQQAGDAAAYLDSRIPSFLVTPANYIGELFDPDIAEIEAGSWYFDRNDHTLNYRVRNDVYFSSDTGSVALVKLRTVVEFDDGNDNGLYEPATDGFISVRLETVGTYRWAE